MNQVTPALFARYRSAADFAGADPDELEGLIHSSGFFRNKARSIMGAGQRLRDEFGGEVPATMEELLTLPGVARKTANVVLGTWFGKNEGVVVDTHVFRIAHRLGLTPKKTPARTEERLMALLSPAARGTDFRPPGDPPRPGGLRGEEPRLPFLHPRSDVPEERRRAPGAGAPPSAGAPGANEEADMRPKKTLFLANPYGFAEQQREGPLPALAAALEAVGAEVWEPFARNNQSNRVAAGWAYRIGQADLRDVREADGIFAVVNGCPPTRG